MIYKQLTTIIPKSRISTNKDTIYIDSSGYSIGFILKLNVFIQTVLSDYRKQCEILEEECSILYIKI